MAKRTVERQVSKDEATDAIPDVPETLSAPTKVDPPVAKAETKPLDVTLSIKAPSTFFMRVWNGTVLFPNTNGNKFARMNKVPIVAGKPITIRITQ